LEIKGGYRAQFERKVVGASYQKRPELYLSSGDDAIDYPIFSKWWKRGLHPVTANLLPDLKSELSTQH